ncbi:MAG: hypothetical protein AAB421_00800 [Patescibacteria group bacterium]
MTKILGTILSLVIAGAVFFIYTQPAYVRIKGLQAQGSEYDAALQKSKELATLKQSLISRLNAFPTEQLERLAKLLPDHVDNVRLVLDLDSLATRYGMAIQNVLISREDEKATKDATVIGALTDQKKKHDSLTLQFSTRATYGDFVRFLEDLESSLRIVDLVGLKIEPEPIVRRNGEDLTLPPEIEPTYVYNIAIRTYWLK